MVENKANFVQEVERLVADGQRAKVEGMVSRFRWDMEDSDLLQRIYEVRQEMDSRAGSGPDGARFTSYIARNMNFFARVGLRNGNDVPPEINPYKPDVIETEAYAIATINELFGNLTTMVGSSIPDHVKTTASIIRILEGRFVRPAVNGTEPK